MTLPASADWKQRYGMEVLCLGEIEVARVAYDGGRNGRPRWLNNLRLHTAFWRDAATVEQARAAVMHDVEEWLRKAGLA